LSKLLACPERGKIEKINNSIKHMGAKTINTRLLLSNQLLCDNPKLFFLTLFWEFVMFFHSQTNALCPEK
jgi:hypothetical protein